MNDVSHSLLLLLLLPRHTSLLTNSHYV